jgi:tetratricopeptide (TPR) repeat protein
MDSPSPTERVWAYNGLSQDVDTPLQDRIPILLAALEIDPEHPNILINLADSSRFLGQAEASLGYSQRAVASLRNPRNQAKIAADRQQSYLLAHAALVAAVQGDFLQVLELRTRLLNSDLPDASEYRVDRVNALIELHQPSALQRLIEEEELRARGRADTANPYLNQRANAAAALEQWPQAVAFLEAWEAERISTLPPGLRLAVQAGIRPRLAYARARTGDLAGAQTLIAATPLDCYPCVRERARIAELAGDRPAADRWSAEARRQGPSLPFAFAERGQMLLARGDVAGAIAFYEQAIERGPRWADPQKYWGDALMARGDEAGAIRKYRAAADRAPQWGALHLAWGRALEAQGKRDQAGEKYTEAARMDLSAADRAEVVRRLGVRPG